MGPAPKARPVAYGHDGRWGATIEAMAKLTHYVFRSVWEVPATLPELYAVLANVLTYQTWWPEIRVVKDLGGGRFEIVARSLLPYDLRFVSEERVENRRPDVIDARLSGDLEGYARWTIEPAGTGCKLVYDQSVDTHKALLNPSSRNLVKVLGL